MAQNIKLKRSAVPGKIPTAAQLAAGELAINTADGKLYFERDDATIQTIVTTNALITGSLNINGSITGSDVKIDDWGSVSASLSAISSNTLALTLQDVTDNGNTTTNDLFVSSSKSYYLGANSYLRRETNSGGYESIQLNGSIRLNPNTAASANNGVVIGGNGYLLAPNSSRNAQLNYGSVSGQLGVYKLNVYGADSIFQHNVDITGSLEVKSTSANNSAIFTRTNGLNNVIISSQGNTGTNYGNVNIILRDYSGINPQDATISYGGAGTDSLVFTTALGASFYITGQPTDQQFVFSKTNTNTSSLYWSNSATPFITKQGANQTVFNGNATSATSASYAANATTAVSATTAATSSYYNGDRLGVGTPTPFASIHIKSGSEAQLLIETDAPFDAGLGYSAGIRFKVEDSDGYDRAKGGVFFLNNSPNNEDWGRGDLILASNLVNNNSNVVPDDWRLKIDRVGDVHIKGNLIITGSVTGNSATATDADKLDGQHGSYYLNASNINAGTIGDAYLPNSISSDITGNAATATALTAGNKTISGNLTVTGTVTAQEFHTEFVSASIVFESGSTQFGNSNDDVHTFTGTALLKTSDVTIGNSPVYASGSSTMVVATVDTTVADVAFLDYVLISGANRRAGTLTVTWYNGTDLEWNDTSTYDIGSTSGLEFSPNYNGTDVDIPLTISSGTWIVKGHLRYL